MGKIELNQSASAFFSAKNADLRRPAGSERRNLIRAAVKSFAHFGFEKASAKLITSEAGLSPAMVNYYFSSKSALYVEALKISVELLDEYLNEKTKEISDFSHFLLTLLKAYVSFAADHPDAAMLVIRSSYSISKLPSNSKAEAAIGSIYNNIRDNVQHQLEAAIEAGQLKSDNCFSTREMLDFILGECEYIFMRHVQTQFFESQVPRPISEVETIHKIFLRSTGMI